MISILNYSNEIRNFPIEIRIRIEISPISPISPFLLIFCPISKLSRHLRNIV